MGRKKDRAENDGRKGLRGLMGTLITALILLAGIALLAYPWISNAIMDKNTASSAGAYEEAIEDTDTEYLEEALEEAHEYNGSVQQSQVTLTDPFDPTAMSDDTDDEGDAYYSLLDIDGTGVMCYIDIPAINVYLPVYHGTSDTVLRAGIGHMENSSLPIGGESTHAVLTGHTGLTSAKLFTDLDELEEGDLFYIHVLGEILAYEITEIMVVEPDNTDPLLIRQGEDLVTLVTCTPYGINSHRLFVTGSRTEYIEKTYSEQEEKSAENTMNSIWMRSYRNAIIAGLAVVAALRVLVWVIMALLRFRRRRRLMKRQIH